MQRPTLAQELFRIRRAGSRRKASPPARKPRQPPCVGPHLRLISRWPRQKRHPATEKCVRLRDPHQRPLFAPVLRVSAQQKPRVRTNTHKPLSMTSPTRATCSLSLVCTGGLLRHFHRSLEHLYRFLATQRTSPHHFTLFPFPRRGTSLHISVSTSVAIPSSRPLSLALFFALATAFDTQLSSATPIAAPVEILCSLAPTLL